MSVPEAVSDLFTGYVRQVAEHSRRPDGLSLRLERLIDEVSDFQGYTQDHTENAKQRALADPSAWEAKLLAYYVSHIRPAREKSAHSIDEARRKAPGKIMFVLLEKGQSTIQTLDPADPEQRVQAALNGATVERMASSRTPFRSPSEVFGRQETVVELESSEAAFEATPGNRSIKP